MNNDKNQKDKIEFINYCCNLLISKYNNDIETAVLNCKILYYYFWDNVRDIYKIPLFDIPLFALFEVIDNPDNFLLVEELVNKYDDIDEYKQELIKKCKEFYL